MTLEGKGRPDHSPRRKGQSGEAAVEDGALGTQTAGPEV